jgi:hypothetical protein
VKGGALGGRRRKEKKASFLFWYFSHSGAECVKLPAPLDAPLSPSRSPTVPSFPLSPLSHTLPPPLSSSSLTLLFPSFLEGPPFLASLSSPALTWLPDQKREKGKREREKRWREKEERR